MQIKNTETGEQGAQSAIPFWHDPVKRSIIYQIGVILLVGLLGYYLISNTLANLERQSIATGFGFVEKESSFEIGESLISYSAADSYGRALVVGVLNTLIVSFIGIILTLFLGTLIGVARLSTNWLVSRLAAVYIEVFQDIPILLQLFFWYAFFYEILPSPRQAIHPFTGIFLCNRGLIFGIPEYHPAFKIMGFALIAGAGIIYFLRRWARKRQNKTGKDFPVFKVSAGILIGLPLLAWLTAGAPLAMNVPALKGFNFKGGVSITPEFTALLLGLVFYTAAFVAEVVRAGIQSVSRGQTEAAMAIGLKPGQVLNLVILPQALRLALAPWSNEAAYMVKYTSIVSLIAVPDLFGRARRIMSRHYNQMTMLPFVGLIYLVLVLLITWIMHRIELHTRIPGLEVEHGRS